MFFSLWRDGMIFGGCRVYQRPSFVSATERGVSVILDVQFCGACKARVQTQSQSES
jgi:hypothetical protein